MQTQTREATIVGVAVFAAAVIAVWFVFYLQGFLSRTDQKFYTALFDEVGLLTTGDNVQVAGVPVGRVQTIELDGRRALVRFHVQPDVEVTTATVAVIAPADLFGEAHLELRIEDGPAAPDGARLAGESAPGLRELIQYSVRVVRSSEVVLREAEGLLVRLDSLLGHESSFSRTLENVEGFTANARDFSDRFDTYGDLLEETLASLDSAATGFRAVVDDNAADVRGTLARLNGLSARMDTLVTSIESGHGTLGRLVRDEKLYEELRRTALDARNLMQEIRDNPDKYLRIEMF